MEGKRTHIQDSLKLLGVIFVFVGVMGIIISSLTGIFKVIVWWQSILLVLLSIFVTVIGFVAFNGGPYKPVIHKKIVKKGKNMSF